MAWFYGWFALAFHAIMRKVIKLCPGGAVWACKMYGVGIAGFIACGVVWAFCCGGFVKPMFCKPFVRRAFFDGLHGFVDGLRLCFMP